MGLSTSDFVGNRTPQTMPSYFELKVKVTIVRAVVLFQQLFQRYILRKRRDADDAYPRRTGELRIPSSKYSSNQSKRVGTCWSDNQSRRTSSCSHQLSWWVILCSSTCHVELTHVTRTSLGSGWIFNSFGEDSDFCELLANKLNITVLDGDYAKAPEHPFPHAYTDVSDILAYVLSNPRKYDQSNITLGGFSAGGAIALGVSATDPIAAGKVKAFVGAYVPANLSVPVTEPPKGREGSTAIMLTPWLTEIFNICHVQPPHSRADPRISTLFADPSGFPRKVCLVNGEYDNLRPDAERLGEKMRGDGVDVHELMVKDVGHAWDKTCSPNTWEDERKNEAYRFILDFLRGVYEA